MSAPLGVGDTARVLATGQTAVVEEITHEGGREELLLDLGDLWLGYTRSELERV